MTENWDPLDEIEHDHPTLAECIEPYRKYGDAELAVSLLQFQRQEQLAVGALGSPDSVFDARSQPANVGADYCCENCDEDVRGVMGVDGSVVRCPLCGEEPGMLALGSGLRGDYA